MEPVKRTSGLSSWRARQFGQAGLRIATGFYAEPGQDPASLENRARAALAAAPPGSVVTGVTAYALAGLPLPGAMETESARHIHLLIPKAAGGRPRRPGLVVHLTSQAAPPQPLGAGATPAADLRRAWADATRHLARQAPWSPDAHPHPALRGRFNTPARRAWLQSVQMGDVLVRRQNPITNQAAFAAFVEALPAGPKIKLVHDAFAAVRAGTDSLPETQMRLATVDAGFPEPAVNLEVRVSSGRYFLDLAWSDDWVDLEYQGSGHFNDPAQVKRDLRRRSELQRAGWTTIEASASDLANPSKLFARLAAALRW